MNIKKTNLTIILHDGKRKVIVKTNKPTSKMIVNGDIVYFDVDYAMHQNCLLKSARKEGTFEFKGLAISEQKVHNYIKNEKKWINKQISIKGESRGNFKAILVNNLTNNQYENKKIM